MWPEKDEEREKGGQRKVKREKGRLRKIKREMNVDRER